MLLPWFVAGPSASSADLNTYFAIVHDSSILPRRDEFLRVTLFDRDSHPVCGACVPLSANDVYVDNAFAIADKCLNKAALDAGIGAKDDNVFFGYASFVPSLSSACSSVNESGDLIPYFYQVQLGIGLAAGIDGPVFEHKLVLGVLVPDFDKYALPAGQKLLFRILVGLNGDPTQAQTQLFVWSDTSGACGTKPDAACLAPDITIVCDEEENCTSQAPPLFSHEANVVLADDFVPGGFLTGGGWLSMQSEPTTGPNLNVLGYADNQANGLGQTTNWRAIFPAQRGIIP